MVSTRGRTGSDTRKGPPSPPGKKTEVATPDNTKSAEESANKNDEVNPPSPEKELATENEESSASERQGADCTGGARVAGGVTQESQGDGEAQSGSTASAADESVTTAAGAAGATGAAAEAMVSEIEEKGASPGGDEKALTESLTGEKPDDGGGEGGEAGGDAPPQGETGAAESEQDNVVKPDEVNNPPENLGQQQQPPPSEEKQQPPRRAEKPQGDGMDIAGEPTVVQAEDQRAVGQVDSSDDEDEDDGFKIIVGREVAPATAAPAVPTKRFLRGTNTLVNATSTSNGASGAKGSDSSSTSSKPASAAAGIASLVPSKGAPVAAERPSLKPGEYPPTAELQQSTGRTAFDVDIDGMEEQPWRHPGVDIADFFNYGFTEDSWRVYCEKQLRNRYDRTSGRSNTNFTGGRGGNSSSKSHVRHGGGDPPRRMENSLQPQRPPQLQMRNMNGPPGPNNFAPQGPAGNNGAWGGGGGGGGPGPERFPHGFGPGPPPGHGNASPPWFDGQPQQQQQMQMQMQMQQQMRPQNRQHFGPGPGPGSGMVRPGMNGGNSNDSAGMRRSRSPDPRDGSLENKIPRLGP